MLKIIVVTGILFFLGVAVTVSGHILLKLNTSPVEVVDIHILFKGDDSRISAFYHLLEQANAARFVIPGISDKTLVYWDKKYNPSASPIATKTHTTSTFEDVVEADRIIRQYDFKTVLLATSDYHMARSWFLLRVKTLGTNVKIHIAAIPEKSSPGLSAKRVYNESVKFWGSLAEYAYHQTTGRLLTENEPMSRFMENLRKVLLFEVNTDSLPVR
jgi:uncharacterized SAM-binding protein YcdF (DUF218 family)